MIHVAEQHIRVGVGTVRACLLRNRIFLLSHRRVLKFDQFCVEASVDLLGLKRRIQLVVLKDQFGLRRGIHAHELQTGRVLSRALGNPLTG